MPLLRKSETHEIDPEIAAADLTELHRLADLNDSGLADYTTIGDE